MVKMSVCIKKTSFFVQLKELYRFADCLPNKQDFLMNVQILDSFFITEMLVGSLDFPDPLHPGHHLHHNCSHDCFPS